MSSLSVYKPANLFIIVSKYFFPIPLLKISSVTVSADVFLYQPEFPWLNSSNIYLLTLLNADTFSFASHLSPAILHSGLNSFPLFQFRFIIFQVHKKSLIAFITHAEQLSYGIADQPDHIRIPFQKWNDIVDSFHRIISVAFIKHCGH